MEILPRKVNYERSMDLPNRLRLMLRSGECSDCSFTVGTEPDIQVFNAHQILLSAASPVFRAMFNPGLAEESPIKIVDIQPTIFQFLLDFIYTDMVDLVHYKEARDLWLAADKYMVTKLIEVSEKQITEFLCVDNACEIYEMAKNFDRLNLMLLSLELITKKTIAILQSPSFLEVQLSTLLMILDSDKLSLEFPDDKYKDNAGFLDVRLEMHLFLAMMRWGRAACERKEVAEDMMNVRNMIEPALRKIRFLKFSVDQFKIITEKYEIFTKDEQSEISKNILKRSSVPLMPEGFSTSRVRRSAA